MRDNLSSFILRAGRRLATAGGCAGNIENFKEYVHKVVGICGVPAGPFGGARVIEQLLPVVRELGLVTIFEDVNFGKVGTLFDERGNSFVMYPLAEQLARQTSQSQLCS